VIDLPATGRERVAAGVLVGAAVLFVGFAVRRVHIAGFLGALTLPLVLLAADLVIAAAVLTWWYPLRPVAQGLAVFGILVHALVMLRSGPVWTRGCSGVLLLVHSWALVQLFLMTAAEDFDDEDLDGEAVEPPPDAEPAEIVETPVTQVVDVVVPDDVDDEPGGPESDQPESDHAESDQPEPDHAEPDHAESRDTEPEHDSEERIR
jgi:hypothetical protein